MTAPRPRSRQPKQLDAGIFQAEISSFALRLAAEDKAAQTIRTYTEAVQWFAAALSGQAGAAGLGPANAAPSVLLGHPIHWRTDSCLENGERAAQNVCVK